MPMFLTLRDAEGRAGHGHAAAQWRDSVTFRPIIVGPGNGDPYPDHHGAIEALGRRFLLIARPRPLLPLRARLTTILQCE
jgi:hypothetical protein